MPTLVPSLDALTHQALLDRYNATADPETRLRYQMVLLSSDQKLTTWQIASVTFRSHDTVLRVINRFLSDGIEAVPHRRAPGRKPTVSQEWHLELCGSSNSTPTSRGSETN
jgi:hypothetical protein